MKIIGAFILGFLLASALAIAGTYAVSVTVNSDTETLLPLYVAQYNLKNGTNYTAITFAGKVCGDFLDKKARAQLDMMGN